MALTAEVPACYEGSGRNYNCEEWIPNPFTKWSDINASYPDLEIRVYGPPTTSGTRASFAEMVNQKAYCGKILSLKKLQLHAGIKRARNVEPCAPMAPMSKLASRII